MNMDDGKTLDISWATMLKIGVAAISFYLLYLLRETVVLVVFSLVISVLFAPAIDFIQRRGINRILAASLVFVAVFGFLGFSVYLISLAFISEVRQVTTDFSYYFELLAPPLRGLGFEAFQDLEVFLGSLEVWLRGASANIFAALSVVFGGVFDALFIFFLAFFFSLEEREVEKAIRVLFPKKYEELALRIWVKSQQKISGWFGTRILASVFVGLATFVALKIFGVNYAISLGLFAGVTNIIPYLGPLFAGVVIAALVLIDDWLKALFVLIVFILIQQVEGNILSPILTKKIIGLNPALVLIALIVGGELFGFLGVILAIPLAGILFDFLTEFLTKRKTRDMQPQ
ncbi:MAG: hypothetical protein G01um101430_542 [Parcubacteria group bacterium Gr01-1014_30]|nr:MAG: hypothetical protein G01um101430_542 [Parcubacteria group bacterium Gr01-1014_30]